MQLLQRVVHRLDDCRGNAQAGFMQKQNARLARHCAAHCKHLAFAARQGARAQAATLHKAREIRKNPLKPIRNALLVRERRRPQHQVLLDHHDRDAGLVFLFESRAITPCIVCRECVNSLRVSLTGKAQEGRQSLESQIPRPGGNGNCPPGAFFDIRPDLS